MVWGGQGSRGWRKSVHRWILAIVGKLWKDTLQMYSRETQKECVTSWWISKESSLKTTTFRVWTGHSWFQNTKWDKDIDEVVASIASYDFGFTLVSILSTLRYIRKLVRSVFGLWCLTRWVATSVRTVTIGTRRLQERWSGIRARLGHYYDPLEVETTPPLYRLYQPTNIRSVDCLRGHNIQARDFFLPKTGSAQVGRWRSTVYSSSDDDSDRSCLSVHYHGYCRSGDRCGKYGCQSNCFSLLLLCIRSGGRLLRSNCTSSIDSKDDCWKSKAIPSRAQKLWDCDFHLRC